MKNIFLKTVLPALCLMLMTGSALAGLNLANGSASGQWYNPARDGEGFYVEIIDTGGNLQISVAMYSYDDAGNQLWLIGNVPIENGDVGAVVPVYLVEGPVWGPMYDPADRTGLDAPFGTITVNFPTCESAIFSIQTDSAQTSLQSGSYSLVRLTDLVSVECTDPPPPSEPPPDSSGTITPGLWTAEGICFFVNTEGTKIVESDACDVGNAFSADVPGVEVDISNNPELDDCDATVACDGAWDIYLNTDDQSGYQDRRAQCVNNLGGVGYIIFDSATKARVTVYQGVDLDGEICFGGGPDSRGFETTPTQ